MRAARIYVPLALLFLVLLIFMPRSGKFNYDYKKGSPWMYETLVSEFDFPILKTQEQLQKEREEAVASVTPYYKYSENIASERKDAASRVQLGVYDYLKPSIESFVDSVYSRGVIAERPEFSEDVPESERVIFVQKNRRAAAVPPSEIYTTSQARNFFFDGIRKMVPGCNADSLCAASGLLDLIVPNLIFDQQTTDLVHEESVNYISPTSGVVTSGQLIVSKGETVTSEIEQLLDSYKAEYEASIGYNGPRFLLWAGNVLLALVIVALVFFTIYYSNISIFSQFNKYVYILVIISLAAVTTFAVAKADPSLPVEELIKLALRGMAKGR